MNLITNLADVVPVWLPWVVAAYAVVGAVCATAQAWLGGREPYVTYAEEIRAEFGTNFAVYVRRYLLRATFVAWPIVLAVHGWMLVTEYEGTLPDRLRAFIGTRAGAGGGDT